MKAVYKYLIIALVLCMGVSLCACGESEPIPVAPVLDPNELAEAQAAIDAAKADVSQYAFLINASADGETIVALDGETSLSICADVPEGMKLAGWTVNGTAVNTMDEQLELTLSENTVVKAEFRPVKRVVCHNCTMQFLNYYEDGGGESFSEFNFEDDYVNSFTGLPQPGGSLLLCVQAPIPAGKNLDHWLINGVAMDVPGTVNIFNAYVTGAAEFEPVFVDRP